MMIRTTATRARFSRRVLLRRMGVGAAMLPMLSSERVRGAGGVPRRIITIAWSNGVAQPNFYSLNNADPTAVPILQPLAPLKSKVTVVAGLDIRAMYDTGHGYEGHSTYPSLFTGTYKVNYEPGKANGQYPSAAGASVDQAAADWIAKSVNLPIPLLNISAAGGYSIYTGCISFRADGSRNTSETDPARLFNTLFAGKTIAPDRLEALKARRKSILDFVTGEITDFSARMSTDDRAKIGGHLDSIRKLELELQAAAPTTCNATAPMAGGGYQGTMKAFNDLVAMAIRCDVTRAVSLLWAADGGSGPGALPFLNLMPTQVMSADGGSEIHAIAHRGASQYAQKTIIDTWYMSQLAYLATALDAIKEVGSTALDNTLIVMGNDMAEGSGHSCNAIPLVMVGSGGGAIRPGRVIKVGSWAGKGDGYWKAGWSGVANNRLLASLMGAMGGPSDSFGDKKYAGNLDAELRG